MKACKNLLKKLVKDEQGGEVLEYALIAGLMGLFCVRLYFARLRVGYWAFLPLQAYTRCGTCFVPVAFAIVLWFAMQFGMLLLQREGVGAGIACGSHLGGLLGGVGLGLLLGLPSRARAEQHLHRGRAYLDRAQWYAAQGEFIEYVRRQPDDDIGHLELARTYRLTGRHPVADQHYRAACRSAVAEKRWDRVDQIFAEAEKGNSRFCLEPTHQMQLAQMRDRALNPQAAVPAYLRLVDTHPHAAAAPVALSRAARIAASTPSLAWQRETIQERLLEQYPDSVEASFLQQSVPARANAA